ncbi:hypothetical protein HanIR_Chr01g0004221 [Helianthus annuus]|nr:hypothetical protein HanIR_Chr01g0004221 [Helianthus annuus]
MVLARSQVHVIRIVNLGVEKAPSDLLLHGHFMMTLPDLVILQIYNSKIGTNQLTNCRIHGYLFL